MPLELQQSECCAMSQAIAFPCKQYSQSAESGVLPPSLVSKGCGAAGD